MYRRIYYPIYGDFISQYKDPYKPTSTMESRRFLFHSSFELFNGWGKARKLEEKSHLCEGEFLLMFLLTFAMPKDRPSQKRWHKKQVFYLHLMNVDGWCIAKIYHTLTICLFSLTLYSKIMTSCRPSLLFEGLEPKLQLKTRWSKSKRKAWLFPWCFWEKQLGTSQGFFVWMLIEIVDLLILNPFQFIIYLNVTKKYKKTPVFRSLWYHVFIVIIAF